METQSDPHFEYDAQCTPVDVAEHLETLARHLKAGRVQLTAGNDSIQLEITENVKLELEARHKARKGKGKLKIEISWRTPESAEPIEIEAGAADGAGD